MRRRLFPTIGSAISGAIAQQLCDALSHAFSMVAMVESAFSRYVQGDILQSEQAYDEAIGHGRSLLVSLGNWESEIGRRLASRDLHDVDTEIEKTFRAVRYEEVEPMLLGLKEDSQSTEIWNLVAQAVRSKGVRGLLTAEMDKAPQLRALARDAVLSLEHARPAVRRGELFESLTFRLDPTYLERTVRELISGLLRLFLIANCSAAIETAAAARRRTGGRGSPGSPKRKSPRRTSH